MYWKYDIESSCFVIDIGYGKIVTARYSLRLFLVAIYFLNFYLIVIRIDILWLCTLCHKQSDVKTKSSLWISSLRTPIQAALKNNIFLSHRLYAVIGIFSLLGNIILLFTDFTLFWMEISFLIYHISISNPDKSHSGFISDNFIFPGCFISFLFATSVGIFFLSIIVEKKLQSFLFDKFKSRMDKSHESIHHQPIQQLDVDIPELRDFV